LIYCVVLVSGINRFYYVSESELGTKNTKMNKTVYAHLERMRSMLIYYIYIYISPDIEVHVSALRIRRGQVPKRGMGRGRGHGTMFERLIRF